MLHPGFNADTRPRAGRYQQSTQADTGQLRHTHYTLGDGTGQAACAFITKPFKASHRWLSLEGHTFHLARLHSHP
eukprot:scaffold7098_cov362-Pinguiococcus_pyrenoidosus.AAC.2